MSSLYNRIRGLCHGIPSLFLPADADRTRLAVPHAALRLAKRSAPRARAATHASPATAPALQRAQTVCRPHLQATLRLVWARDDASQTAPSGTARSHASTESPPPYRGYRHALLPP